MIEYTILTGIIVGGLLGFYYLKTRVHTRPYLLLKNKDLELALKDEKKKTSSWRAKYYQMQSAPNIEIEGDNVEVAIDQLIDGYLDKLPKWAQPLAKNKELRSLAIDYAKNDPEKAMSFIKDFLGDSKKATSKEMKQAEQPQEVEVL